MKIQLSFDSFYFFLDIFQLAYYYLTSFSPNKLKLWSSKKSYVHFPSAFVYNLLLILSDWPLGGNSCVLEVLRNTGVHYWFAGARVIGYPYVMDMTVSARGS